ncbi:hypothetical protein HNP33_004227 [Comamonas odontotermitis]|uniref:TMhelix containing protein n=1 Tax=Comamonas odontotermitis TaxID=379895 RepID=A0ABR6RLS1_9BURK|nr:hypothetical protein [Comamonas odontotermitis]
MTPEVIQAIGNYIVGPICVAAVLIWIFKD